MESCFLKFRKQSNTTLQLFRFWESNDIFFLNLKITNVIRCYLEIGSADDALELLNKAIEI